MPTDYLTDQQLQDAARDADDLGKVVNEAADFEGTGVVNTRLNGDVKTVRKVIEDIGEGADALAAVLPYGTTAALAAALPSLTPGQWVYDEQLGALYIVALNGGTNELKAIDPDLAELLAAQAISAEYRWVHYFSSNVTGPSGLNQKLIYRDNADRRYWVPATATEWPDGLKVTVPIDDGALTSVTVTQQTAAGAVTVASSAASITSDEATFEIAELDGATGRLEIQTKKSTSGADAVVEPPILHARDKTLLLDDDVAVSGYLEMRRNVLASDQAPSGNLATNLKEIQTNSILNAGGPLTFSGRQVTCPEGTKGYAVLDVRGVLSAGDEFVLIVRSVLGWPSRALSVHMDDNLAGGINTSATLQRRYLGSGMYEFRGLASSGNGNDPEDLMLDIDNRDANGQGPAVIDVLFLHKQPGKVPLYLASPPYVTQALKDTGLAVAYVDAVGGSDTTGDGTYGKPFLTAAAARASGATSLGLRAGQEHRVTSAIGLSGPLPRLFSFRAGADTEKMASLRASIALTQADMTQSATDPNVWFTQAVTQDPQGVWEEIAGVLTRFGQVGNPSGDTVRRPHPRTSAAFADVQAAAGRWWFGAGPDGTAWYVRPSADSWAGKTYEVPVASSALAVSGCGLFVMEGVEVGFGISTAMSFERGSARVRGCRVGYSGQSDGCVLGKGVDWIGVSNEYLQAGDDGINTEGEVQAREYGIWSHHNVGDGVAPHLFGNDFAIFGGLIEDNGKQGYVSIGRGLEKTTLRDVVCRNNYSADILVQLNTTTAGCLATVVGCTGEVSITNTSDPAKLTALVEMNRGSVATACQATVRGQVGSVRCNGGVMTLDDFKASNGASYGLRLDAGTLSATNGHILRNAQGLVQNGGALILDAAKPINVFGNGVQFVGVSAPDQAKAQNFNAI